MKVSIWIDKVTALKAGSDNFGRKVVQIPASELTAEQRETLARFTNFYPEYNKSAQSLYGDADFYLHAGGPMNGSHESAYDYSNVLTPITIQPTKETVIAMLDAIREEKLRRAAEAQIKAEQEAAEKAEKERVLANLRDQAQVAILADPTIRGQYFNNDGSVEVFDPASGKYLRFYSPSSVAEELRRRCETDKAQKEAEELAETERKNLIEVEKDSFRDRWIAAHGTESQRERFSEGLLPNDELSDTMRESAFAELGIDLPPYEKLRGGDIECGDECYNKDASFSSKDATEATEAEYAALKNLRACLPETATASLRVHTGECGNCEESAERKGILVEVKYGPFTFHREFAV